MKKASRKRVPSSTNKVFPILILIATIFMSVGYASINSISLNIDGEVVAKTQDGIFITEVNYVSDVNANLEESKILNAYQTNLNSNITLSDTDVNSSITYEITIYNSNDYDYSFLECIFTDEMYDNENIIFYFSNLKARDVIPSKEYLTFEITFKYGDDIVPSSEINKLHSYLNFKFVRLVEYIESTGTQYIDTEIKPDNNTTFEFSFSLSDVESNQAIYGTRTKMVDGVFHVLFFYKLEDVWQLRWDEGIEHNYIDLPYSVDAVINIEKNDESTIFSTNGSSVIIENSSDSWSIDSSIYVFNQNQQDSAETRFSFMKLYYLNIYQNGKIVRNFFPALDENGVACLYELVTNSYFYNNGTGDFNYS